MPRLMESGVPGRRKVRPARTTVQFSSNIHSFSDSMSLGSLFRNSCSQNTYLEEQSLVIFFLPNAVDVSASQLVARICNLKKHPFKLIERSIEKSVVGTRAIKPIIGKQLLGFCLQWKINVVSLATSMIHLNKETFRSVEVIVKNEEHHALLCLLLTAGHQRLGVSVLPESSCPECTSKKQQARCCIRKLRPVKEAAHPLGPVRL